MPEPYQIFIEMFRNEWKTIHEHSTDALIDCLLRTPDEYVKDFKGFYPTQGWSTFRMRKEAKFFRNVIARQLRLRTMEE